MLHKNQNAEFGAHLSARGFCRLTVNSSHGELVTCDEFTFSPKSELVTVNSSQGSELATL